MPHLSFQYAHLSLIVSFTFLIVESSWDMSDPVKSVGIMQFSVVVILCLLTLLWRQQMTDVKYLDMTPSFEVSKIDVVIENKKSTAKYIELVE